MSTRERIVEGWFSILHPTPNLFFIPISYHRKIFSSIPIPTVSVEIQNIEN
jgi:hypothetical protein